MCQYDFLTLKADSEELFKISKRMENYFKVPIVLSFENKSDAAGEYEPHTKKITIWLHGVHCLLEMGFSSFTYQSLGTYVMFHELGHSQDPNASKYKDKLEEYKINGDLILYYKLKLFSEFYADQKAYSLINKFNFCPPLSKINKTEVLEIQKHHITENLLDNSNSMLEKFPQLAQDQEFKDIESSIIEQDIKLFQQLNGGFHKNYK